MVTREQLVSALMIKDQIADLMVHFESSSSEFKSLFKARDLMADLTDPLTHEEEEKWNNEFREHWAATGAEVSASDKRKTMQHAADYEKKRAAGGVE